MGLNATSLKRVSRSYKRFVSRARALYSRSCGGSLPEGTGSLVDRENGGARRLYFCHRMKNACVVFIESNTTGTGRLFVKAAMEYGYQAVMLAERPERYPFVEQDSVSCRRCDSSLSTELEDAIQCLSRESALAGIFSSSEYFLETAAVFAAKYGLSGANPEAVRACRNKWIQRQCLQRAGLHSPKFERITSAGQTHAALEKIPPPVVVKPTMGSGSVGVRLCFTAQEVVDHASVLLERTVNERGIPLSAELLIEEYLVGQEYSVETFGETVLGITRKHVSPEPFFVELGHDFPADLSPQTRASIAEVALQGLRALGLNWGPGHVEIRLTAQGPAIVEINPRLAGGFIPEIMRLAFGIDMVRETIRLVVGEKTVIRPIRDGHASIRFLTPSCNGVITAIHGVEEASGIEGVADIQTYRNIGDRVGIENDFRDRIGHVISCGDRALSTARASELACHTIEIQVQAQ
jgi:biotin carboxylase